MKAHIKNKHIQVKGLTQEGNQMKETVLACIVSNDNIGKTLTIHNGKIGFTIPFEPIERCLK